MHFELIRSVSGANRSILKISEEEAWHQIRSFSANPDKSIQSMKNNPFGQLIGSDGIVRFNNLVQPESISDCDE